MILNTPAGRQSLKEIKEKEAAAKEAKLRETCEALAIERFGVDTLDKLDKDNGGLWYLPIQDKTGNVVALAVMKPIDRHILSYASTKIEDDGLYAFLEAGMRECFLLGDESIIDNEEYFIPAARRFNKIMEGYDAAFLKR